MIARLYSLNKQFINLKGKLLVLPKLIKAFIMDALGYGWDRNRAIDTLGTNNNALMGGYLLAASNTVIDITGILTTDTIKALTKDGLVGSVVVTDRISFTTGNKYGAFEVYRAGTLIGRYCLTERQGLQIINQVTGGLPNGLLGGTTTTVWQRSNAFYSETNERGYSISGTGWVTSAGAALTVGTIIPADPLNPTKCMAWVSGVQQDLQYVGKAKNSVSVVPLTSYYNEDRYYMFQTPAYSATNLEVTAIIYAPTISNSPSGEYTIFGRYANTSGITAGYTLQFLIFPKTYFARVIGSNSSEEICIEIPKFSTNPLEFNLKFISNTYKEFSVTDLITREKRTSRLSTPKLPRIDMLATSYTIGALTNFDSFSRFFKGYIQNVSIKVNGQYIIQTSPDRYSINLLNLADKTQLTLVGISTYLLQNVDLVYNAFNQTGYELWYNGADYRIYPLASDGTRIITPAGYTLVETVTAGNMPSIADSRFTTFKYALANSYAVRQSVPEAYDATDPCAPKLLTYAELSALSANPKVIKTEADGKITNIKIK